MYRRCSGWKQWCRRVCRLRPRGVRSLNTGAGVIAEESALIAVLTISKMSSALEPIQEKEVSQVAVESVTVRSGERRRGAAAAKNEAFTSI